MNPQAWVRARCYCLPNRLRVFKSYNYILGFVACLKLKKQTNKPLQLKFLHLLNLKLLTLSFKIVVWCKMNIQGFLCQIPDRSFPKRQVTWIHLESDFGSQENQDWVQPVALLVGENTSNLPDCHSQEHWSCFLPNSALVLWCKFRGKCSGQHGLQRKNTSHVYRCLLSFPSEQQSGHALLFTVRKRVHPRSSQFPKQETAATVQSTLQCGNVRLPANQVIQPPAGTSPWEGLFTPSLCRARSSGRLGHNLQASLTPEPRTELSPQ